MLLAKRSTVLPCFPPHVATAARGHPRHSQARSRRGWRRPSRQGWGLGLWGRQNKVAPCCLHPSEVRDLDKQGD